MWIVLAAFSGAFLLAFLAVHFGGRQGAFGRKSGAASGDRAEGSQRAASQLLLGLVTWAFLLAVFPLLVSFREHLSTLTKRSDAWLALGKVGLVPLLVFLLFVYAARKRGLDWASERDWPRDERR